MSVLFISHGELGHQAAARLGHFGLSIGPALDFALEDSLAQVRLKDADDSAPRQAAPLWGVDRVIFCEIPELGVDGPAGRPGLDLSPEHGYTIVDLGEADTVEVITAIVAGYVNRCLLPGEHHSEPFISILGDCRSPASAAAMKLLIDCVEAAGDDLAAPFQRRGIVTCSVLSDYPETSTIEPPEPSKWGFGVNVQVSTHTQSVEGTQQLETDGTLAELGALLTCALDCEQLRHMLFSWRQDEGSDSEGSCRRASVGVRAVTTRADATAPVKDLARELADLALGQTNERHPAGMQAAELWPKHIGVDPEALVERLLEQPATGGQSSDMRNSFGSPSPADWDGTDASGWTMTLLNMRARAISRPGAALAARITLNAQKWREDINRLLAEVVDEAVERGFVGLPDARFVLGELDQALSETDVSRHMLYRSPGPFEARLEDLRGALIAQPHSQSLLVRYTLTASVLLVPLTIRLSSLLPGAPGLLTYLGVLIACFALAWVASHVHERRVRARIIRVRDEALAGLGQWLVNDLENRVLQEVAGGVASLRTALAQVHAPALDRLIHAHDRIARALDLAVGCAPEGFRTRSAHEFGDRETEVPPTPEVRRCAREFLDEFGGRSGWRTASEEELGQRMLAYSRNYLTPKVAPSLETTLEEIRQTCQNREDREQRIAGFLSEAVRERALSPTRLRGRPKPRQTFLMAPGPDYLLWQRVEVVDDRFRWTSPHELAVVLSVDWHESRDHRG